MSENEETANSESSELDAEYLDGAIDRISDKLADAIIKRLTIWLIRTSLGLIVFGILWYYYDWGVWVFWSYVVVALISLCINIYFNVTLVSKIANLGKDEQ